MEKLATDICSFAKLRNSEASGGTFDFTEVCGEMHGCMMLTVTRDKLTIRVGDRKEGAPDLDCLEIGPDKSARRLSRQAPK